MSTPRLLWLGFERPPHPDAVCHAATAADVEFVLEWLDQPEDDRIRIAEQLRRFLDRQAPLVPFQRPNIPCRRPAGFYVLIPWRFAKWLACILPATGAVSTSQAGEQQTLRFEFTVHDPAGVAHEMIVFAKVYREALTLREGDDGNVIAFTGRDFETAPAVSRT